jgi:phospholipid N-methyltransferase
MPQNIAKIVKGQIEYRFEVNGLTVVVLNGGHCSRDSRLSHERLIGHGFSVYMNGRPTRPCCAPNTLRAPSAGMLNDGIFDVQPPWGTCLIFKHFFVASSWFHQSGLLSCHPKRLTLTVGPPFWSKNPLDAEEVYMQKSAYTNSDYGIDAPPVIRNLFLAGIASIVAGIVLNYLLASIQSVLGMILLVWGLLAGASMIATGSLMLWSSKVGKLQFCERLIDSLALRGTETILDVGCGRGLLLNAAARRLTTGKAIGIDLWQSVDQSGNNREATLANARAEGVADIVEVKTGDMRELPFEDQTIDVVVSSLAIHNIPDQEGRARAVQEIARVLKPQGQVALLDFQCTDEYDHTLQALGWHEVKLSGLQFQMFPPVRVVTGRKPL